MFLYQMYTVLSLLESGDLNKYFTLGYQLRENFIQAFAEPGCK